MEPGILMNLLVCLSITFSAFAFSYTLCKYMKTQNQKSQPSLKALLFFWSLVGLYFLFEGLQLVLNIMGISDMSVLIHHIGSVPFVMISIPLTYFIVYIISGSKRISQSISLFFALMGAVYLYYLFLSGVVVIDSKWGMIFTIKSSIAILTYILGLFIIPTAMILGLMILILFEKVARPVKYQFVLTLFSISFVFDFILLNMVMDTGEMQAASRIFVFLGTVLGFLAYFPPRSIEMKERQIQPVTSGDDDLEQI